MPSPHRPNGPAPTENPTIDEPPASPPDAVPVGDASTARVADTAGRPSVPRANAETGAFSDPSTQTGKFEGRDSTANSSSMTGAYTPSGVPAPGPTDVPVVPGYEILDQLGRGGMGVVYRARQVGLDRLVALKMILAGAHARPKDLERFRGEAQAVARFQHPNIVQIFEVGESGGLPYFSLELVDGGTLAAKIAREPQPPRFAAEIVESLARAMQYAHERGVVHRDLKPANVLLAVDGTPKVTDFGLAKRLEQDSGQTQAGAVLGTPSYMAPEQALGDTAKVGPPADVYALGAILYDLLTGRPPFAGTSVLDTLEMVRTREPVPPGDLAAKLPRDLETICLKCLHKEPERRYAGAGELADDLRRYLDGIPILARPVGAVERSWRWAKRNPWVAGLGSATAILVLAVAVITTVLSVRLNARKNEAEANFQAAQTAREKEEEQKRLAEIARDDARNKEKLVGEQRNLALDTVRGISRDVDSYLKGKLSLAPLRIAIQNKMLSDVDKIRNHAAQNPLFDRAEGVALFRLGDIYMQSNRIQDAAAHYRRVRAIFDQFIKDYPDEPAGRSNMAAASNSLADTELRLGNAEAARELYAEALNLRQEWVKMVPKLPLAKRALADALAKRSVADSYALLGRTDLVLGEPGRALDNFRTAERKYADFSEQSLNVRQSRAQVRDEIAQCLFKLGKTDEARTEHRAALQEREKLAKANKVFQSDVAHSHMALGDFYLFDQKNAAKALAEYVPAYKEFAATAKADPDDLNAKHEVSALAYRMGFVAERLADDLPPSAVAMRLAGTSFYQECLAARRDLAKADPTDTRGQIDVMIVLARLGRTDEVEAIAGQLWNQVPTDRRVLFQVACGLVTVSGKPGPAAKRCREQAFDVLEALVGQGWKDRVALETDPDLDAVRGDPRFKALLEKIPKGR
jgi:eukaryotic-like serine/threonine-protein kinase